MVKQMDKAQALHSFWSGFGLTAYDENTVPEGAQLPYITYSVGMAEMGEPIILTASLWYHSTSWAAISQKAELINRSITPGGVIIPFDGGSLWIWRGSPFSQRMEDPDPSIRRIYMNINAEFLSSD